MISGIQTVCEWLEQSGTTLYGLIGLRVYKARLYPGFTNASAAVLVMLKSGKSHAHAPVYTGEYEIYCFGGTADQDDAESVFNALKDALHAQSGSMTTGGIVYAELTGTQVKSVGDSQTGYPVYVARYTISTTANG